MNDSFSLISYEVFGLENPLSYIVKEENRLRCVLSRYICILVLEYDWFWAWLWGLFQMMLRSCSWWCKWFIFVNIRRGFWRRNSIILPSERGKSAAVHLIKVHMHLSFWIGLVLSLIVRPLPKPLILIYFDRLTNSLANRSFCKWALWTH